jgi:hypothetical protein
MFDFQLIPVAEASVVTLMQSINRVIINPIIFFMFAVAMVYFLYGVTQYFMSPDSEEVRKKSKSIMLWGIVGLFIMVAVFGIMRLILSTVGESKIKIQDNGNYEVSDYNVSGGQSVYEVNQGSLNSDNPESLGTSRSVDVSSSVMNQTPPSGSYTISPFTAKFVESPQCWRKELYVKEVTEYKALNSIEGVARARLLADTGLTDKQVDPRYPIPFQVEVLYDKVNKYYYAWWDARAPINGGTISHCRLGLDSNPQTLPEPQNQSKMAYPLSKTYVSDATMSRGVGSGVDKVLGTARGIAMTNALYAIAKERGLTSIETLKVATVLEEKQFGPDPVTGNYDYWVALEIKK